MRRRETLGHISEQPRRRQHEITHPRFQAKRSATTTNKAWLHQTMTASIRASTFGWRFAAKMSELSRHAEVSSK
jgi:hypothetical protein